MSDRFEIPERVVKAMAAAMLGIPTGVSTEEWLKVLRVGLDAAFREWQVLVEEEPAPSYQGFSMGPVDNPRYRLITPWEHQGD